MKKLVYILSVAIGLIMTGCAQWEEFDSLSPETWGPKAELTIEAPDTLKSDVLSFQLVTKNATHMGLLLSLAPVEVNYTALLQGKPEVTADVVGVDYSEVNPEGEDFSYNIPGVVAGEVYYIYVVVANEAGVQTTATHVVGAIDVEAPIITSTPQLTATEKGRRVTLSFSENIIRDETMGAIEYATYLLNVETGEASLYTQGSDVTAVASGSKLTVTLPVVFDANSYYVATLSFAEGAVTDLYGNKMAPVASSFDASTGDVTNGYWWLVEPAPDVDPEAFFNEGSYYFYVVFTEKDQQYEADLPVELSYVADGFDLSRIFKNVEGMTATEWSLSGILASMYRSSAEDASCPALTYTFTEEGQTIQDITIIDYNDENFMTSVGYLVAEGASFPAYLAFYQGTSIGGYYWDFVLADQDGNFDAPVEDLIGHWGLPEYTPAIFAYGDLGNGEGMYLIMSFDYICLTREASVQVQGVKRYETPVKMEYDPAKLVPMRLENKVLFNK